MINENNWRKFQYFSKDPNKIIEKITGDVLITSVPLICFSPTQRFDEFLSNKEKRVKKHFEQEGC